MKKLGKSLLVLVALGTSYAQAMQSPAITAIHAQNKATSATNEARNQNKPYFTLFVMQPTDGYQTLNSCVNFLYSQNKMPVGYGKIPDKDWHISTIAIAVPFRNQPNPREVQRAAQALRLIVRKYKRALRNVAFQFHKLSSIGTHKFIAAHYDFSAGRREFLEAYAHIIQEFLTLFPDAYMYYGYKFIPHVSVASTARPGGPVNINTSQCRHINNVALLHSGRNLHVATGYYDPATKQIVKDQTGAI
jgi:hypothetical protein